MANYLDYDGLLHLKDKLDDTYATSAQGAKADGAIQNPTTKSNGQVLTYNGTNWVAQTPAPSGVSSVTAGSDGTINVDNTDEANPKVSLSSTYKSKVDNAVPNTTKINNKALSSDVTLTPADLGIGSVFTLKGSKNTKTQLPTSDNVIGDVWYVIDESVGYIWLNDGTTNRWEQLGMTVDLSTYWAKSELIAITNAQIDTIFA